MANQQQKGVDLGQLQVDVEEAQRVALDARRAFERAAQALTVAEDSHASAVRAFRGGCSAVSQKVKLPI
jgi:hypothetical protein